MKTKIALNARGVESFVDPNCVKNWSEIACSYKRADFSGVVRSFTSKFEFALEAADTIFDEFLANGYNADVKVSVWTLNNSLVYEKQFECPLDFSTLQRSNGILTISAVDNSIAAKIKSNKSTKYELGHDCLQPDSVFLFDRLEMSESATYEFTQGTSNSDGSITVEHIESEDGELLWLGNVANEISVGGSILYKDDQETETGSYILECFKEARVHLDVDVVIDKRVGYGDKYLLFASIKNRMSAGYASDSQLIYFGGSYSLINKGAFATSAELPAVTSADYQGDAYAIIAGEVWRVTYADGAYSWINTHTSPDVYFLDTKTASVDLDLVKGDRVVIRAVNQGAGVNSCTVKVKSSRFHFTWKSRGDALSIPACSPLSVLESLIGKMCGMPDLRGRISNHDPRLANTLILAAEDVRNIPGAKLYSSFSEFCDWMETVFGYTYYISDFRNPDFASNAALDFAGIVSSPYGETEGSGPAATPSQIFYDTNRRLFFSTNGGYYYDWHGGDAYNDPVRGLPYVGKLYRTGGKLYHYDGNRLVPYRYDLSVADKPYREIAFVHRSELFDADAPRHTIGKVREVTHTIVASDIYSSVEIGYEKKDYDSLNGRDEFNFCNTYTTGCSVSDKKLSLISKYRADSYGLEFAAQKRSKETTDSDTDNDVFFVLVDTDGKPDRSVAIAGALNPYVFNGAFSPMACVEANSGFISRQSESLQLTFASSKGNSDIVIGSVPMSSDLTASGRLMTVEEVSFTTCELDIPDTSEIIVIESDGVHYEGFLKEVDEHYAMEEALKYKLIVKNISKLW